MGWEGIRVTEENVDKVSELMERMYQRRKSELSKTVSKWPDEVEAIPEILKVRMEALKEVNPEKFSDSPELVLSTLAAAHLIRKLPTDITEISREDMKKAHERYDLAMGDDVNPYLVADITFRYFEDVKSGAITKDGKIRDIEKSRVMTVVHNSEENGVPKDAKTTVAKYKKQDEKDSNISSRLAKFFGKGGQGE